MKFILKVIMLALELFDRNCQLIDMNDQGVGVANIIWFTLNFKGC